MITEEQKDAIEFLTLVINDQTVDMIDAIETVLNYVAELETRLACMAETANIDKRNLMVVDPLVDVALDEYLLLGMAGATE